ncbi:MAG TPA: hypothetical protein VKB75_00230 [Jatrophihabitans sp.]|nr:hypothetical protein [Jatrophihabitans sp.]
MGTLPPTLIALIVVGALAFITRWVFRPSRPNSRPKRPVDATDASDLGLLTVVLSGLSRDEALERRATLGAAGIRSSTSARRDGTVDVLVFQADAEKARILLGP